MKRLRPEHSSLNLIVIPERAYKTDNDESFQLVSANQKDVHLNGYKQFEWNLSNNMSFKEYVKPHLITVLSLQHCNIRFLPDEIHCLPLRKLDLQGNQIANVPKSLYLGLDDLEILDLSYNPLYNFYIPPRCVSALKVLKLDNCNLHDIPSWILQMQAEQLEELNCSMNIVKPLDRSEYPLMPVKIKKLEFANCKLRQQMLQFFAGFHLLQYLDISNKSAVYCNSILDLNEFLATMNGKHLKALLLNNVSLTDLPDGIGKLHNLEELHIMHNMIDCLPDSMCNLKKLRVLKLSNNSLDSLSIIIYMIQLEILHAASNYVQHVSLGNLSKLKSLDLYNNNLESIEFGATNPDYLDLEQNYLDTKSMVLGIEQYVEKRAGLRETLQHSEDSGRHNGIKFARPHHNWECGSDSDDDSSSHHGLLMEEECHHEHEESDHHHVYEVCSELSDGSDWGTLDDLVTHSDREYQPEMQPISSSVSYVPLDDDYFTDAD